MNIEEFKNAVKKISENHGVVWVEAPFRFHEQSKDILIILFDALFECKRCGKCCNGFWFSVVPLHQSDFDKIILSGITWERFKEVSTLTKLNDMQVVCLSQPCKFFEDSKCSIYSSRPNACRWFPVIVSDKVRVNVSCPAGLEVYVKLAEKNGFDVDSTGL